MLWWTKKETWNEGSYNEDDYATRPANKQTPQSAKKPSARDKQEEINIEDIPF